MKYHFDLAGTTTVKASNGSAPLNGTIDAVLDLKTGNYTAALVLKKTTAKLSILGFLPGTADVDFAQVGDTTGTLKDGVLTSSSKVIVKLPSVKLLGVEIAGGPTCVSKTPADIALKSTEAVFNPLKGGPITGTYTIPELKDCGALTAIVNPFAAGPGNVIKANLTR
ncbi:hypothetical protein GCM10010468_77760 [Actinocorallia longicatena]|uniref:Uncharacterized protein n=1 Tax=Actinocorallia longicatena TaxID=111803 RepID=A0ABP6QN46_9ACTN